MHTLHPCWIQPWLWNFTCLTMKFHNRHYSTEHCALQKSPQGYCKQNRLLKSSMFSILGPCSRKANVPCKNKRIFVENLTPVKPFQPCQILLWLLGLCYTFIQEYFKEIWSSKCMLITCINDAICFKNLVFTIVFMLIGKMDMVR